MRALEINANFPDFRVPGPPRGPAFRVLVPDADSRGSRGRSAVLHAGAGYPSQAGAARPGGSPRTWGWGTAWRRQPTRLRLVPLKAKRSWTGDHLGWKSDRLVIHPGKSTVSLDFEPPLRLLGSSGFPGGGAWGAGAGDARGRRVEGARRRARVRLTTGLQYPLSCAGEPARSVGR